MRNVLLIILSIAYPFAIYFGRDYISARWLALLPLVLVLSRGQSAWRDTMQRLIALAALAIAVFAFLFNNTLPLKIYPVLVNVLLLGLFALSLWHPPTIVERIARLTEPDMNAAAIAYTRRVTQVWCVFFIFNGLVSTATALWTSEKIWTLYNGFVAYVLMGLLFACEWLVRQRVKARHRNE